MEPFGQGSNYARFVQNRPMSGIGTYSSQAQPSMPAPSHGGMGSPFAQAFQGMAPPMSTPPMMQYGTPTNPYAALQAQMRMAQGYGPQMQMHQQMQMPPPQAMQGMQGMPVQNFAPPGGGGFSPQPFYANPANGRNVGPWAGWRPPPAAMGSQTPLGPNMGMNVQPQQQTSFNPYAALYAQLYGLG